jgi:hypothetical protein
MSTDKYSLYPTIQGYNDGNLSVDEVIDRVTEVGRDVGVTEAWFNVVELRERYRGECIVAMLSGSTKCMEVAYNAMITALRNQCTASENAL